MATTETTTAPPGAKHAANGILPQICTYFRDFLDSDFRRQRLPKRSIDFKDNRGNLTGVAVAKYPAFIADLWTALAKPIGPTGQLNLSIPRGKYRSKIRPNLLEVIDKHCKTLEGETLAAMADRAKANARELLHSFRNDPDQYQSAVLQGLRNDFVRTAVGPLLQKLDAFFERQSTSAFETAYNVEDELSERLIADAQGAVCSALATAIVDNQFQEFDAVIDDVAGSDTVSRRIVSYFEAFNTSDFFEELHELRSTLKLRENFEIYLYLGEVRHGRVTFPLFYLPLEIRLEDRIFRVAADPHLYVNKKALDYAAQETARELGRATPILVEDRIIYLPEKTSFTAAMQPLLDRWCAELALKPPIDLADFKDQRAQRSQLAITNAIHFAAFDKSDEALLNDYEEVMTLLASGASAATDFAEIVMGFLKKDPVSVTVAVEKEWTQTSIPNRLVFQSPVPLNEEQRKILSALRHPNTRFVAIEGPPGTGKSHTITAIVFQAILDGQNVLVLSDKKEALDVVEDKLTHVLNSVRFGSDFQNPILRLGKSGSSYGKILAAQSIEAIRAHLKATTATEPRLTEQIQHDERFLTDAIQTTVDRAAEIQLKDVAGLCDLESKVQDIVPDTDSLVGDDAAIALLDAVSGVGALLSRDDGEILEFLLATGDCSLLGLEGFLKLQKPYALVGAPAMPDLTAMRFFAKFAADDLRALQALIDEYHKVRWPLLGFLLTAAKARQIDQRLAHELAPVTALAAHKNLSTLEQAHRAFSSLAAKLNKQGIDPRHHAAVFQQVIDGVTPKHAEADRHLQQIAQIRSILQSRPELREQLGVDDTALSDWTPKGASANADRLRRLAPVAAKAQSLRSKFEHIPKFDYAGDKAKLESLHAQRLAHTIDSRVIAFADNHRNLSRSIRDIISKKQRFPREQFEALKKAFPCMIAGIRDYAEYVPLESGLFDLVIIDEASQVSIAQAFPAFIRAKRLVVLGDQKQFSNVKTTNASIELNAQYMNAIVDNFRKSEEINQDTLNRVKLFNIKTSVLSFVERIANYQAMLRKHFRGYPELISFSSKTFYNSQLQAVKIRGKPIEEVICFTPVETDGQIETSKNVNRAEYDAILTELRRLADFDEPPSVGIITPFNEQQALIVQQLSSVPDAEELQDALNLKVMTFDTCQGEERDVIIYSMVASATQDKLSYIFPRSLDEADEVDHVLRLQRLNVGFSRAKERIHIFHSQPLADYRGAIGRALNHYDREMQRAHERPTSNDTDPLSPMEGRVLEWLNQTQFVQAHGDDLEIDAQFELGSYLRQLDPTYRHPNYRVDFLLTLNTPKRSVSIVIEYDGFKEHFTDRENVNAISYGDYYKAEDVERQKILEGYGYRFLRINRFNLGRDPVQTLNARLYQLTKDAQADFKPHAMVQEVKNVANGIANGDMKTCPTCKQVKALSQFHDSSLKRGIGRKCADCKASEAKQKSQRPYSEKPWRRRRRRRW